MNGILLPGVYHLLLRFCTKVILDCICLLQNLWQLALLRLQLRIAADVLVVDEDVRNRALLGHLFKSVLDSRAIVFRA